MISTTNGTFEEVKPVEEIVVPEEEKILVNDNTLPTREAYLVLCDKVRIKDLRTVIKRYLDNGIKVEPTWFDELIELEDKYYKFDV